jgi:predicted patatin/cPLA2 family phospholipase
MKHEHAVGLVLEGGAMRGIYTAGVLDAFLKNDIHFPYVVSVSAGTAMGASYVSRQFDRSRQVVRTFINDHRYMSFRNLIREGYLFSRKFAYDTIPNHLIPFDMKTFLESPTRFVTGTTDCVTGDPVYFDKDTQDFHAVIAASAGMPFMSRMIDYQGLKLLDGGISDSIPIRKAMADGYERNVLILTRPKGYLKTSVKGSGLIKFLYRKYPKLAEAMLNRACMYNETLTLIEKLEAQGKVFVIQPSEALPVSRLERCVPKLQQAYDIGFAQGEQATDALRKYVSVSCGTAPC